MSSTFPAEVVASESAASRKYDGEKVTIYRISEFLGNVVKTEARLHEAGFKKYAQYDRAPFVVFTPKRKRKKFSHTSTERSAFILVVKGWDAPEPGAMFTAPVESSPGVSVSQSRFSSFDDGWKNEFNAQFNAVIEAGEVEVVEDFRGVNPYTGEKKAS